MPGGGVWRNGPVAFIVPDAGPFSLTGGRKMTWEAGVSWCHLSTGESKVR
ncbi:hypothetical protein ACFFX0_18215 [Citricoccus parietis]|uniref:Uncharacterized protein n=1 Tax=Citricoccus parietis TaxID=592307 RepID=A0ABV5G277_9MICC